ncbi:hypothetical protein NMY22_g17827 [Coprinellus aureogranulatus]|nr:hypothetical protein NMY22_g17827 [Coprinellus aureogranulatus]
MRPVTPTTTLSFGQAPEAVNPERTAGAPLAYAEQQGGLLIAESLNEAIARCQSKVERIAQRCRAGNKRFRDIEFDLEGRINDCLYSLFPGQAYSPVDIRRVPRIFDQPQFFDSEGYARVDDIVQGQAGDCWLLSALATVSSVKGLIERLCVARDEDVGVYGFVFFQDNRWVPVVIDDLLWTATPLFEELTVQEQALFHYKKELYNKTARKGGGSLYFARPSEKEITWLPLMEKAYAKLHGSYSALFMGQESEAMEELTGGVATVIISSDILDPNRFWHEDLLKANQDRLFGCSFSTPRSDRNGDVDARVQGLVGAHAYSVLRAVEVKGKRFVIVRNPWGKHGWSGPWSDGSKEWSGEWLKALPLLGHTFGNDGQFVMEYDDWLRCFTKIHKTLIFDSNWVMSSHWLRVTCPPLPAAPSYGNVSFILTVSSPTPAVIGLSELNDRHTGTYIEKWNGCLTWQCAEVELEAGTYIVHVRLDREVSPVFTPETVQESEVGKISKILTARAKSQRIASNFAPEAFLQFLSPTLEELVERDFSNLTLQKKPPCEHREPAPSIGKAREVNPTSRAPMSTKRYRPSRQDLAPLSPSDPNDKAPDHKVEEGRIAVPQEDLNTVYLGLRVYTKKDSPATIEGRVHDRSQR